MVQASSAVTPRDSGGPWGTRIGVTVGGTLNWALRVSAYATGRVSSRIGRVTVRLFRIGEYHMLRAVMQCLNYREQG
jgi:hypothetical protein